MVMKKWRVWLAAMATCQCKRRGGISIGISMAAK